jgi:hypothetical protein
MSVIEITSPHYGRGKYCFPLRGAAKPPFLGKWSFRTLCEEEKDMTTLASGCFVLMSIILRPSRETVPLRKPNKMTSFDYTAVAELFSSKTDVEQLHAGPKTRRRVPVGFGRFARAAYAIRYAVEELPARLFVDAFLTVHGETFDHDAIRRLYDSEHYPLIRRALAR